MRGIEEAERRAEVRIDWVLEGSGFEGVLVPLVLVLPLPLVEEVGREEVFILGVGVVVDMVWRADMAS